MTKHDMETSQCQYHRKGHRTRGHYGWGSPAFSTICPASCNCCVTTFIGLCNLSKNVGVHRV
ncbi:hypothetical protein BS47DRAFT_1353062 [Hydnum rufescens UP504]|uniref:Uncharacterized protein n=1 Tax=Hydnum rufescens UP504 TaxID=1448309 RepID=A0A9P6AHW2_9AGAM|nr:hypothetical protein BS47DRAFT_1353062 [Hydnum rufescens UP504]